MISLIFALPQYVRDCISLLETAGFEAYCVGGAVRDMVIGRTEPSDFDVATNCPPQEVMRIFRKAIPTGIEHGTVTVLMDGTPIEVTTYRVDGDYADARHPDSVKFVGNIKEDLARRDFTVNAIAYNEGCGVLDLYGGCDDIKNKILRTVGDPDRRFSEDALRIMRLFRFASQLGFSIDEDTLKSAKAKFSSLESISAERIFSELKKMLLGAQLENAAQFFKDGALESFSVPACDTKAISLLPRDLLLRFSALMIISGADAEKACRALKTDNALREHTKKITNAYKRGIPKDSADIKRGLSACCAEDYIRNLTLIGVLTNTDTAWAIKETEQIIRSKEPYLIEHLRIGGNDLKAMGLSGEEIGDALAFLQDEVIKNPLQNNKKTLKNLITKHIFRS